MMWKRGISAASLLGVASLLAGCVIESHEPWPHESPGSDVPSSSGQQGQVSPVVVEIDPNRTLSAEGGEGVGVFVEYVTGGEWHVFWTCDTQLSGRPCEFEITATARQGELTIDGESSQRLVFESVTQNEIHEVYFVGVDGADLELEARVDGERSGRFFFFVQDGEVNGGYDGTLTNPVVFRPRS